MTSLRSTARFAPILALALAVVAAGLCPATASAAGPAACDDFYRNSELSPNVALVGRQFHVPTVLGPTGMTALVRIMGFLLVCVGVQFIALGVVEIVTDEKVLGALLKGLKAAGG